ncbi:hypothetical protein WJX74_009523 [Apatococcus lobatus]|uniref:Uncharacterized protein n=1 Tax=Apatococcus lobatus TaxID=904363 RepID=A0AAW1QCB0_9CHLO
MYCFSRETRTQTSTESAGASSCTRLAAAGAGAKPAESSQADCGIAAELAIFAVHEAHPSSGAEACGTADADRVLANMQGALTMANQVNSVRYPLPSIRQPSGWVTATSPQPILPRSSRCGKACALPKASLGTATSRPGLADAVLEPDGGQLLRQMQIHGDICFAFVVRVL